MRRVWLILAALLCLAGSTSGRGDGGPFDVISYDVELTPHFAEKTISGRSVITLRTAAELSALTFSANSLTILRAQIDGAEAGHRVEGGRLIFTAPAPADA